MSNLDIARTEIYSIANTFGIEPPEIRTIPGTTSIYRHGPRDIFMSDVLLEQGSTNLIRKVAAHEAYHQLQHASGLRNMKNKPITELEAESMALDWMSGKRDAIPLIPRPLVYARNIQDKRPLFSTFDMSISGCGYCSPNEYVKGLGFLDMARMRLNRFRGVSNTEIQTKSNL